VPTALLEPPVLEDLTRDGRCVTRAQLEAIVADGGVRAELARPDVRALVAGVDASPSREVTLAGALQNAHLAALCERVLDVVSQ
jgi:hypothetical protein